MTLKRLKTDRFFLKPTNQASFKEALMLLNRTVNSLIVRVNEVAEYNTVSHEDISLAIQKADEVYTLADSAATDGAAALTTAGNALSVANGIDAKATSALSNANTALETANLAYNAADGAILSANTALDKADTAIDTAEAADTKSGNAIATANAAQLTANGADSKADQAISDIEEMDFRVGFNSSNVSSIITALGGSGGLPIILHTASDFVGGAINELVADINHVENLTTTAKTVVPAINEMRSDVGSVASLTTTAKTLVTAVNELKSVIDAKKTTLTLLQSDITLSTNESAYFTDAGQCNLYMVMAYDTTAGISAWVSVTIPASDSVVRYAHTLFTDTLPFSLIRNGVNCTLKREGSSSCMYKVYGIK